MRWTWTLGAICALQGLGQPVGSGASAPIRFNGALSVPLNAEQLLQQAVNAWRFSFGLEPGARMEVDTLNHTITGSARFNFRSGILNGREETMGPIAYRIRISTANGECEWVAEEFKHTGNRHAPRGGSDLGLLTKSTRPELRFRNMSYPATVRVWEDAKGQVGARLDIVGRLFEAQLRRAAAP